MEELAKRINVSGKSTINEWEKGRTLPNKVSLKNIADFFQVTIDYIKFGSLESYVSQLIRGEWVKGGDEPNKISVAIQSYLSHTTNFYQMWDDLTTSDIDANIVNETLENAENSYLDTLISDCLPYIIEKLNKDNIGYDDNKIINISSYVIQEQTQLSQETFSGTVQNIFNFLHDVDTTRYGVSHVSDDISIADYMKDDDPLFKEPRMKYDAYFNGKLTKLIWNFQEQLGNLNEQYILNLEKFTGSKDLNPFKKQ